MERGHNFTRTRDGTEWNRVPELTGYEYHWTDGLARGKAKGRDNTHHEDME
jgi:hypothetical protein